jgi:RimJ/RimL family protein N-acetyltransferase
MNLELLRGTKLRLAALSQDDAPRIARWCEDTGYLRLQDTNRAVPKSVAQIEAELEQFNGSADVIVFGIRTRTEDELIGLLGFYEIEWSNQVAWLGMGIGDRNAWGKGYGTEALRLGLQYAFDELNLHRLTLTVIDYNTRAIALYEKAGFRQEGVFREFGQRDGKRYDMYLYGLLRPEWEAKIQRPTEHGGQP